METRLIVGYGLIALMVIAGLVALAKFSAHRRERRKTLRGWRRRDR